MTTTAINAGNLTLLDRVKRANPDGSIANIIEMLAVQSPIIRDAVFMESNLPTGHLVTQRTALPSVGWRRFNEGTTAGKSKTDQFTESCGMLSGISYVDCSLAELNGNAAAFRASEDMAFLSAMKKEMETAFVYSSTLTDPEKVQGLIPRLASTTAVAGSQIVLADSTSGNDQSSILLVGWGDKKVYGIYPKGTAGGLVPHDMGVQLVDDGSGTKKFRAYVTNWEWKIGVVVEDWRYLVRIANIDQSAAIATGDVLVDAMIRATHKMEDLSTCKPVFYMNRANATTLHLQAKNATKNSTLSWDNVGGRPVGSFMGIPIEVTDAILNTEAPIS